MNHLRLGIACEDNGHYTVATRLVDAALLARHTWLTGKLPDHRSHVGLAPDSAWYKYDPTDANDLRPIVLDGRRIAPSGHIAGKPLRPEAGMWRKILLLFCHRDPRPDAVLLLRDLDGYPDRLDGMQQAAQDIEWPFPIAIAAAQPEIEAWWISGFTPSTPAERGTLHALTRELSFDPTLESHRLTSHPNDAATDAKRVLSRLCGDDPERRDRCLEDRHSLRQRGLKNGLTPFLDEIDRHVLPAFR